MQGLMMTSYLVISLCMQLCFHFKDRSNDLIFPTLAPEQLLPFVSHFRLQLLVVKGKQ